MPCEDGGTLSLIGPHLVTDWANVHPYVCGGAFIPTSVRDLVKIVQFAELSGRKLKAVGSKYSLSKAPDSDDVVIETSLLSKYLSRPYPTTQTLLPSGRFRSAENNANWLQQVSATWGGTDDEVLVHVEAGIRIKELIAELHAIGLGLPTMGAAGGQTLAGAISTGTHGSDVEHGPLSNLVRAVHLVGEGGQEWWIEGNAGAGGRGGYAQWPNWCPDTIIVRDDDFLRSVVVGLGRFGIVYSMVIAVVADYWLEEKRGQVSWPAIKGKLQEAAETQYESLFEDARFWSVVIDSAGGKDAWLTRRWVTTSHTATGEDTSFDLLALFCRNDQGAQTALTVPIIAATTVCLEAGTALAGIPFIGPVLAAPYFGVAIELVDILMHFKSFGTFVAEVVSAIRKWDDWGWGLDLGAGFIDDLLREISRAVLEDEHSPSVRRGPSHKILDTHNYNYDGCLSVNSLEYFFDAGKTGYLSFIDDVLSHARSLGPMIGVVALRFLRPASAKLGMQRFARTVAIEVAIPRPGNVNAAYIASVHASAHLYEGIAHWGQENVMQREQVQAIYGTHLRAWRWALAETEQDMRGVFSSGFTRDRGLEIREGESLPQYRLERYCGAMASGFSLISS